MPSARSNARGAGTRAKILSAAVACLGEGGIDDVRIARVAERAGISTASVHYHFDTRESLLAAAIDGYGLRVMLEDPAVPPARALEAVWAQVEQELLTPARR